MIKILFSNGADPEFCKKDLKNNPLVISCLKENLSMMNLLLLNGMNPNLFPEITHPKKKYFPVFIACSKENEMMLKILVDHKAKPDVGLLSMSNKISIISLLISSGADVNLIPKLKLNNPEMLELFVSNGGDLIPHFSSFSSFVSHSGILIEKYLCSYFDN